MKKFIIGFIVGFVLTIAISSFAFRVPTPPKLTDLNDAQVIQLNDFLDLLWQVVNGNYTMDFTTTNPDGARKGNKGDAVLLQSGANYYLEVNVDSSTTWRGAQLTDAP